MWFHEYKAAAIARLSGHAFFSVGPQISVLPDDAGDLVSKMQAAMARLGVCVLVAALEARSTNANLQLLRLEPLRLIARVRENVNLNRGPSGTRQPADYVAEVVASLLHGHRPAGAAADFVVESLAQGEDLEGVLAWDVIFTIRAVIGSCDTEPERLAWP